MLKSISRILIAGTVMVAVQPALSMEIYTVKSNDYLYKIAKNHSVEGISTSELTDAIKGINKSEIPGIVDNRIKIGDKLAIPTTKGEVEDGLTLTRNEMIQGSYDQDDSPKESEASDSNDNLGDDSMVSENSSEQNSFPSVSSQDKIPTLIPTEDGQAETPQTYKNDLSSSINSDNVEETQSYDEESASESSFLGSLFKLVVYLIILAGLGFVAKRFWDSRNSKKEQELEIISKRKRDHLMSRISPVVSDSGFYGPQKGPQEEFDFFANNSGKAPQRPHAGELEEEHYEHSDLEDHQTPVEQQPIEDDLYGPEDRSRAIKTEKGVVFETNTDESLINTNDDEENVAEIDSQAREEQELQYVEELIEQYLDSEKYVEASITIQDSLEKNQNNIDLRYKLLEVYARAGDEIAFEGEVHFIKSKNIVSMFDPLHQKIAKLRDKYFD